MTPFEAMQLNENHFQACKVCTLSVRCPEGARLKKQYEDSVSAQHRTKGAPVPRRPERSRNSS